MAVSTDATLRAIEREFHEALRISIEAQSHPRSASSPSPTGQSPISTAQSPESSAAVRKTEAELAIDFALDESRQARDAIDSCVSALQTSQRPKRPPVYARKSQPRADAYDIDRL